MPRSLMEVMANEIKRLVEWRTPIATEKEMPLENAPETMSANERYIYSGLMALQFVAHKTSLDCGWYHDPSTGEELERNNGEMIALMHSELSEALEADRKDLMDDHLPHRKGIEVELADLVLRIFDFGGKEKLDIAGAVIEKNRFNRQREDHKPENRAAGGKKY